MSGLAAPSVSAFTAGLLIILQMLLLLAAVRRRRRARQSLGDGGDEDLTRAVRRHGNLAENAAIFIVCAALYEMLGGPRPWVEGLCAAFLLGRVLHAVGLSMRNTVNLFRVSGVALTVAASVMVGLRLVLMGADTLIPPLVPMT